MKSLPALAFLALLVGCASNPHYPPEHADYGSGFEREVLWALGEVKADTSQRSQVLAALDSANPQLMAMGSEAANVRQALEALNPRAADYLTQTETLAQRSAAVTAGRLRTEAQFNRQVATTLSDSQWSAWTRFMTDQRAERQALGYGGGGRRRQ